MTEEPTAKPLTPEEQLALDADEIRFTLRCAYERGAHARSIMALDGSYMSKIDTIHLCFLLGDYRADPQIDHAITRADYGHLVKGRDWCAENNLL